MWGASSSRREKASGLILQVKPRERERERKKERKRNGKKEKEDEPKNGNEPKQNPSPKKHLISEELSDHNPCPETVTIRHGLFVKQQCFVLFQHTDRSPDQEVCVTQFDPPKLIIINQPKTERTFNTAAKKGSDNPKKTIPEKNSSILCYIRQETRHPKPQRVRGDSLIPHYS